MRVIYKKSIEMQNAVLSCSLTDSIDGVAYKANMVVSDCEPIQKLKLKKKDAIEIKEINLETNKEISIFNGIIWKISKEYGADKLNIEPRERCVYLSNSEDEYMFKKDTADSRIKKICGDWGIPIGKIAKMQTLDKKVDKGNLLDMIKKYLKENVKKGGKMYVMRMEEKLNFYELGSNKIIHDLEPIITSGSDSDSLEGAVTQVKVLGKSKDDKHKTPVIGVFKKDTDKYGTLQKLKQEEKIKNKSDAKKAAEAMFNSGERLVKVNCAIDIITIRAGDKVRLYGKEFYVVDITHNIKPNRSMSLTCSDKDYIKRKFFEVGD